MAAEAEVEDGEAAGASGKKKLPIDADRHAPRRSSCCSAAVRLPISSSVLGAPRTAAARGAARRRCPRPSSSICRP